MATASKPSSKKKSKQKQVTIPKDEKESLLFFKKRGNTYGGYGVHLLKEDLPPYLKSFVICYDCKGILRDACGVGDPQVSMCFVCTQGRDSIVLRPSREAVASLTVSCPLKSRGCGWEGNISESEPHLDVCGLFRLECKLSCGDVIQRSDMSTHLDKNCPFREVQCERCALFHKEKETNIHQENCLEFPLKCPNECGDVVQRKNLKQHTEQVCQNAVIECPYKEYGCEVKVARREMEQHKSENRLIHLEIKTDSLCGKLQVLQEENSFLKEEIIFDRRLLLFEGKTTFRINNITKLGSEPKHVANFWITDLQNDHQNKILCHAMPSVEPTGPSDGIIIGVSRQELPLKGCILVINQSDNSIYSKQEYHLIGLQLPRLTSYIVRYFIPTEHLAIIPYEHILQPGVCVNDSILVQMYYNRVPQ